MSNQELNTLVKRVGRLTFAKAKSRLIGAGEQLSFPELVEIEKYLLAQQAVRDQEKIASNQFRAFKTVNEFCEEVGEPDTHKFKNKLRARLWKGRFINKKDSPDGLWHFDLKFFQAFYE